MKLVGNNTQGCASILSNFGQDQSVNNRTKKRVDGILRKLEGIILRCVPPFYQNLDKISQKLRSNLV